MAKIIQFTIEKGGVGKTTMSSNFAATLATDLRNPSRVLLIDGDGQGHAAVAFGIYEAQEGLAEVLAHEKNAKSVILPTSVPNLDILPANDRLFKYEFNTGNIHLLAECLSEIADDYDYFVIESAPARSPLIATMFDIADVVVTPIVLDAYSEVSLSKTVQLVNNFNINNATNIKLVVLPNMYNKQSNRQLERLNGLKESDLNITLPVRQTVAFADAVDQGRVLMTAKGRKFQEHQHDFKKVVQQILANI
ncbi:ParA family protein [Weissella minor]|uniref:ParA family protein n=1 Tax=Weissella minor TaxID=1620 RepID=UPI003AF28F31